MVELVATPTSKKVKLREREEQFRLGLYFGSFNPPHLGHLTLAEASLSYGDKKLDGVIFMPGIDRSKKPFMLNHNIRVRLLDELLENGGGDQTPFHLSTLRIDLYKILENINFPVYGYASKRRWADVFAIRILQEVNKGVALFPYFIVGGDKIPDFVKRDNKELLIYGIESIGGGLLCYPRDGSDMPDVPDWMRGFYNAGKIQWDLEGNANPISSSEIRRAIAQNSMRNEERGGSGDDLERLFVCSDQTLRRRLIDIFSLEQEWKDGTWRNDPLVRERINKERRSFYNKGLLAYADPI